MVLTAAFIVLTILLLIETHILNYQQKDSIDIDKIDLCKEKKFLNRM